MFSHNFLELYSTLFEKRFLSQILFFFNGFSQPSQWLKSTTLLKVFYQCSLRSSKPTSVSWVNLSRKIFIEITKSFGTYLFASRVLLTKFGLSVSSVLFWSPRLIENLTITHNMWFPKQQSPTYILADFSFAKEPETERKFEVELCCFEMLFTKRFS